MKKNLYILLFAALTTSCKYFENHEGEVKIPNLSEEELQDQRYKTKRDNNYKDEFLHQDKTENAIVTIFNVFPYQIRDEAANIGEGFSYMIVDLAVDNP